MLLHGVIHIDIHNISYAVYNAELPTFYLCRFERSSARGGKCLVRLPICEDVTKKNGAKLAIRYCGAKISCSLTILRANVSSNYRRKWQLSAGLPEPCHVPMQSFESNKLSAFTSAVTPKKDSYIGDKKHGIPNHCANTYYRLYFCLVSVFILHISLAFMM